MCSLEESVKHSSKFSESSTTSSGAKDRVPKLKVLHASDSNSGSVVSYKTNWLLDKSQTDDGKVAARMAKYAIGMLTMLKAYKFDDKYPPTRLRFLVLFKRARASNRIFKSVAL